MKRARNLNLEKPIPLSVLWSDDFVHITPIALDAETPIKIKGRHGATFHMVQIRNAGTGVPADAVVDTRDDSFNRRASLRAAFDRCADHSEKTLFLFPRSKALIMEPLRN